MQDMKGKAFSIMADESTDCTTEKHMVLVARYFSGKKEKVTTAFFLSLIPIKETTGWALFDAVKGCLELKNCIGYASDGAANMDGCHNSLWSRI